MKLWPFSTRADDSAESHEQNGAAHGYASEAERMAAHQGWLVAENVQKSYKKRMVVRGVLSTTRTFRSCA